jgi:hypothetical protein
MWPMRAVTAFCSAYTSTSSSTKRWPFALVIRGDHGTRSQFIANAGGGEMLHRAADMHPRPRHDIVAQCPIADVQDRSGMDETFARIGCGMTLGTEVTGDRHRLYAPHRPRARNRPRRSQPAARVGAR